MANVNAKVEPLAPSGLTGNKGYKFGLIESATKAAQNDTVTISNADTVVWAGLTIDADGSEEAVTISSNVITLKDATTGAVSGLVVYK